jgi:hypothetical protein
MPPRPPPSARSTARTLHSFLIASTLIVSAGAAVAARSTGHLRTGFSLIDWAGVLLALAALPLFIALRGRLPVRPAAETPDAWWQAHLGRAVLLWSLLELAAILGAAALLATGSSVGFAVLAVVALGGLLTCSPARLAR